MGLTVYTIWSFLVINHMPPPITRRCIYLVDYLVFVRHLCYYLLIYACMLEDILLPLSSLRECEVPEEGSLDIRMQYQCHLATIVLQCRGYLVQSDKT